MSFFCDRWHACRLPQAAPRAAAVPVGCRRGPAASAPATTDYKHYPLLDLLIIDHLHWSAVLAGHETPCPCTTAHCPAPACSANAHSMAVHVMSQPTKKERHQHQNA